MPQEEVDRTANYDSAEALQAAAHNFKLLQPHWCECGVQGDIVYFCHRWTHGWMCAKWRGIVQIS